MTKVPYEGTVHVQEILNNDDLSIDEKAKLIHRYDYDTECRMSDIAGISASMSVREVAEILIERGF